MSRKLLLSIAQRLMSHPAAPYHEHQVRTEAEEICREHALPVERDNFGNLYVQFSTAPSRRPLVLAAHLDHPGFSIIRALGPRRFLAEFRGGVSDEFFKSGIPLRLMPQGAPAVLKKRASGEKRFELEAKHPQEESPSFAVWELPDFAQRGVRIHGRACDDLIGAASVLATILELKRRRARVHVVGLLSRAEEIGFHGALMAAQSRGIPRNALVISLETSREIPPVKMGEGMIIRVGDRTSIFDSDATRYLTEVGGLLRKRIPDFKFQRALMSGGTCEATAFQEYGFQTGAVCVALGNYHNCGSGQRIAAEFVDIRDVWQMVQLLAESALQMRNFAKLVNRLPTRLRLLSQAAREAMRRGKL